jgi:CubicO group peptidase (beta-lactamase class C family)
MTRRGLLTAAGTLVAQTRKPVVTAPTFRPLTLRIERGLRELALPGAALLVFQNRRTRYLHYFGEYGETTVVPVASASKWLTAATVMSLVEEGQLELDAPVSRWVPAFNGRKAAITVRQLLSHTSGVREQNGWDVAMPMAKFVARVAAADLAAAPGAEFQYGNTAMQIAAFAAETVTGKRWNEIFQERIAGPCEMAATQFAGANPMVAGAAVSTLRDYGRFLEMILHRGIFRGRRVLRAASIQEMQRNQVRAKNGRPYGLGQWVDAADAQGETVQVSSPGSNGFRPWLHVPRQLFGVLLLNRAEEPENVKTEWGALQPFELIQMIYDVVDRLK